MNIGVVDKDNNNDTIKIEIKNKQMQLYTIGQLHNNIINDISLKHSLNVLQNEEQKEITDMKTKIEENITTKIEMLDKIQELLDIPLNERIDMTKLKEMENTPSNAWSSVHNGVIGSLLLFAMPALL